MQNTEMPIVEKRIKRIELSIAEKRIIESFILSYLCLCVVLLVYVYFV